MFPLTWLTLGFLAGQAGQVPIPPIPPFLPAPFPVVPWVMEPPAGTPKAQPPKVEAPHDLVEAIVLITTLPNTNGPVPSEDAFPAIREAVHKVAIDWEILDTRETSYIFAKRSDFESDLNLLRRRYQDFKDAPPLSDSQLLPERKLVNDLVQFNRAYRKHLVEKHLLEQDRAGLYEEVMIECDQLYKVWDAVRDARCEFYYITVRRQALIRLKQMLGEEDYRNVNLPPNVPTWRFNEGK